MVPEVQQQVRPEGASGVLRGGHDAANACWLKSALARPNNKKHASTGAAAESPGAPEGGEHPSAEVGASWALHGEQHHSLQPFPVVLAGPITI